MKRQVIRTVAGANVVAGCLLLQGCGILGPKKAAEEAAAVPVAETEPAVTQPVEATPVQAAPVEVPAVASTTPYTVQKGDTLSGIAYKYGLRWQDVVAVNPGIVPTRMRVGQVIQLPGQVNTAAPRHVPTAAPKVSAPKTAAPKAAAAGPAVTYTVKSGDSLSVIAQRHGVKVAAIREANALKSDRIVVGQKLSIPGAKKAAESAAVKKPEVSAPKTQPPKTPAETAKPVAAPKPPVVESAPVAVPAPAPAPGGAEAAPAPAPAADANTQTYTVKEGEDIYAVAIRWGVSPSDLKALNNLTSTELKAGTVLKIPGGAQ